MSVAVQALLVPFLFSRGLGVTIGPYGMTRRVVRKEGNTQMRIKASRQLGEKRTVE
jgi:hypothetical protein